MSATPANNKASIYKGRGRSSFRFCFYDNFFEDNVEVTLHDDYIEFKRANIDSRKAKKSNKQYNGYHLELSFDRELPLGRFKLDDVDEMDDEDYRFLQLTNQIK